MLIIITVSVLGHKGNHDWQIIFLCVLFKWVINYCNQFIRVTCVITEFYVHFNNIPYNTIYIMPFRHIYVSMSL